MFDDDEEFFEEDIFIEEEEEAEKVELPEHLKRQTKFGENREEVQMQQAQVGNPEQTLMESDLPEVDKQAQTAALFSLRNSGTGSNISGNAREMLATEDDLDEDEESSPDDLDDISDDGVAPPMA